jgi:hypothetical protein
LAIFSIAPIVSWRGVETLVLGEHRGGPNRRGNDGRLLASRHWLDFGLPLSTAITGSMLAAIVIFWPYQSVLEPVPVR